MGAPKSWLADLRARFGSGTYQDHQQLPDCLGILAFEAGATMARLISLHRSLSEAEISRLRSSVMRSEAVAYLNSADQAYLLRLACTELLSELDHAADATSRLASRCHSTFPRAFGNLYADAKAGSLGSLLDEFKFTKGSDKRIKKMERLVEVTSRLYAEMDTLNELEASERRMDQWKRHSGPIPIQKPDHNQTYPLRRELKIQRQKVRKFMEESLWSVTFDEAVQIMAKSIFTILYRICSVFSQIVPGLPYLYNSTGPLYSPKVKYSSGPLERPIIPPTAIRNSAPLFIRKDMKLNSSEKQGNSLETPPGTVGSSGMALRYANLIVSAERLLEMKSGNHRPSDDDDHVETREELYEMLPVGVRSAVKAKLKDRWRRDVAAVMDERVAVSWRQAVEGIMSWLGPVARDTMRWHDERNMDRVQRFNARPRALMLQTLHFSDTVKAEAAIVEVLVGLSCICWYDEHRRELNRE